MVLNGWPSSLQNCSIGARRIPIYVVLLSFFAATGGIMFGYDLGVSGGVTVMDDFLCQFFPEVLEEKIRREGRQDSSCNFVRKEAATLREGQSRKNTLYCMFGSQEVQLFTSSLYLAAMAGTCLAAYVSRRGGRKVTIVLGSIFYDVGVSLNIASGSIHHSRTFAFSILILGRLMLGIGVGFANQAIPLYISEIAPADVRGALNHLFQLNVTIGILAANIVNLKAEKIHPWGWRLSLGLAGIPALLMTMGSLLLIETPNSLVQRGYFDEAQKVLKKLRGENYDALGALQGMVVAIWSSDYTLIESSQTPSLNNNTHPLNGSDFDIINPSPSYLSNFDRINPSPSDLNNSTSIPRHNSTHSLNGSNFDTINPNPSYLSNLDSINPIPSYLNNSTSIPRHNSTHSLNLISSRQNSSNSLSPSSSLHDKGNINLVCLINRSLPISRHTDQSINVMNSKLNSEDDSKNQDEICPPLKLTNNPIDGNYRNSNLNKQPGSKKQLAKTKFNGLLDRSNRPPLIIAIAVQFCQQFTGINVVIFYAPVLFKAFGSKTEASLYSALVIGTVNLVFTLVSILLVDRLGRRRLLIQASCQIFLTQVLVGIILIMMGDEVKLATWKAILVLMLVCAYVSAYSWSWGPLGWLISTEIFPLACRSEGQSVSVFFNMLFTFLIAHTTLSMLCTMKFFIFFFFSFWAIVMGILTYFFLPETMNIEIEVMSNIWSYHWFWKRFVSLSPPPPPIPFFTPTCTHSHLASASHIQKNKGTIHPLI